ncbi:MAG: metallophosphoesterase [Clostridia bacterium]|nr:metallophosphoesterase [Clostridia bacterium]
MKLTHYTLPLGRFNKQCTMAVISDLHGGDPEPVLDVLWRDPPDYILMPGDLFERLDGTPDSYHRNALRLFREAAQIAPVFYSTGNHEDGGVHSWSPGWRIKVRKREYHEDDLRQIRDSGVTMLADEFVWKDGIAFGGLCSGLIHADRAPDVQWLEEFCRVDAPRVLLCHHPEYYEPYLKHLPIDLIVSGHAHGGQWRFFGRGVFAPGQGLFPKYTFGVHDGRFVISAGLKKAGWIPRFGNPPELVYIHFTPETQWKNKRN